MERTHDVPVPVERRTRRNNYLIRNQTPHELVLLGPARKNGAMLVLRLSPLQRRSIGGHPVKLFSDAASFAQLDHAVDWEAEPVRGTRMLTMAWLAGIAFAGLIAGVVGGALGLGAWAVVAGVLWLFVWLGLVLVAARRVEPREDDNMLRTEMEPSRARGDWWDLLRDLAISVVQGLVGVLLIVVAIGAPALAIYYGTEVHTVITLRQWDHWELLGGSRQQYILVARCLQLVLLIVMSVLPALMFFQFDREKLTTLIDRWLHSIFRLDPSMQTVSDVDAKYGRRVEEFFGASLAVGADEPRRRLRNRTPVVIATVLIAVGWIVILVNTANFDITTPSFQDLFVPNAKPLTMAFLGSYFLSVQVALRGYVRGDLKPKTYNVMSVRIIMALILAWALTAVAGSHTWTLVLSFLAGITPNTVLLRFRDFGLGDRVKRGIADSDHPVPDDGSDELAAKSPLTLLDEIDVYERTRLEEEGITCIEALARHDLVDLMLSSRIPVPRLIDWLDQAVLYQHVAPRVPALHKLGVRSATDFLLLWSAAQKAADAETGASLTASLKAALGQDPTLLETVLEDDEWMAYICNWRKHDGTDSGPVTVYDTSGRATLWARNEDHSSPSTYDLTHPPKIDPVEKIDLSDLPTPAATKPAVAGQRLARASD